jgi:NADPH2:quinone reductase
MSDIPSEMTAYVVNKYGDSNVFEDRTVETPSPDDDEVLVEVAATSVNPIDAKIRRGDLPDLSPLLPAILHGDVAGTVAAVGSKVTKYNVGDRVFGLAGGVTDYPGALAEYTVTDETLLASVPENIDFEAAAALPIAGLTAWEMVVNEAAIQSENQVLVHGGTGGVGHFAVQYAAATGADVVATVSSAEKADQAGNLGATDTANYETESVQAYTAEYASSGGFDVVIDTVGDENLARSFEAVAPYGTVVSTESSSVPRPDLLHEKALSLNLVLTIVPLLTDEPLSRLQEGLKNLSVHTSAGDVSPLIDSVYELSDVEQAHRRAEHPDRIGKVVLEN